MFFAWHDSSGDHAHSLLGDQQSQLGSNSVSELTKKQSFKQPEKHSLKTRKGRGGLKAAEILHSQ